jgi:glutamate--cysteine ligase catalytic subunit
VLKQAFDDRTEEELGISPLAKQRHLLKKSRFDTTDVYLSSEGSKFNDFEYDKDDKVYETLIEKGMDPSLAQHFANMFTRDPLIVVDDDLKNENENFSANFDIFNCTNWRLLRFKPPPMNSLSTNRIGWRVEFRPTEIQFTDFENSAFCSFIILLTRAIAALNLSFLIGITRVSENMDRAQNRNACMKEKFYFRQNVHGSGKNEAELAELSIHEIINGNDSFKGLVYYIYEYLKTTEMTDETKTKIDGYLKLITLRASGDLLTPASWIRKFVLNHGQYKQDSKVSEEVNYDLMWNIYQISNGLIKCPDLLP